MPVIGDTTTSTLPNDAPDGSFATWDATNHTWLFVPSTTVMRTGVGSDSSVVPSEPPSPPIEPPGALGSLVDAGSYYFPNGISADEAPANADPAQAYVMAVTSSPDTATMQPPPTPGALVAAEPPPVYQAGIQILTLLNDPSIVYRRGFIATDPVTFTDWARGGGISSAQSVIISGGLYDPSQLPAQGEFIGQAYVIDGDLWVWR